MPIETSSQAAPVGGVQATDRLLMIRQGTPPTAALVPPPSPFGLVVTMKAGAAVFGKRIGMIATGGIVHADPTAPGYNFAGMIMESGAAGADVPVMLLGIVTNPSWPWTPPDPLYVYPGGVLEHTPPTSGIMHCVAFPLSATSILLLPEAQLQL